MKSFKKFLLEQNMPNIPGFEPVGMDGKPIDPKKQTPKKPEPIQGEIAHGTYTITPRQALINRLGSKEAADKYIKDIRERRANFSGDLNPSWILPSISDEDLDTEFSVSIDPEKKQESLPDITFGESPYLSRTNPETKQFTYIARSNPDIVIYSNPENISNPIDQKQLLAAAHRASEELKPDGKRLRDRFALTDTLWHELQHTLQQKQFLGKTREQLHGGNYNATEVEPRLSPLFAKYVTRNVELPAFASEGKSRFRDYSQNKLDLGANMSQETMQQMINFFKNSSNPADTVLYDALTNPKTSKQAQEMMRQVAKKDTDTSDTYTA